MMINFGFIVILLFVPLYKKEINLTSKSNLKLFDSFNPI